MSDTIERDRYGSIIVRPTCQCDSVSCWYGQVGLGEYLACEECGAPYDPPVRQYRRRRA